MQALGKAIEGQKPAPEIQRFPVQIDGERAWLIVKDGQIESINWENGKKITIIDHEVDFMKEEQRGEGKGLYSMAKEILAEIEEKGARPVFTVPREYGADILKKGLEPHATWIKEGKLLAGTIAIPYYNKEGDRIICVVKNNIPLKDLSIKPRLTGTLPAVFQGVIATESHISKDDLIFIDSVDYQVLNEPPVRTAPRENTEGTVEELRTATKGQIRWL